MTTNGPTGSLFDPSDVLAGLEIGVAHVARDWRITYANAAWAELAGGDGAGAYVRRDLWDALPALAAAPEAAVVRNTHRDGVPRSFRVRHPAAADAGATLEVHVRAAPGVGGLLCTLRDVTAEDRLEQVQDRVLESIGEGLLVAGRDWRLTYVNAAAERITGVPRARALGRPVWEAYPTLLGTPVEAVCRAAMAERVPHAARTTPVPRRLGGEPAVFDAQCYPVVGDGVVLVFNEVAGRERQTRALAARSAENERLRELARAMAAERDAPALLDTLCAAGMELCGGAGAAVAEVDDARCGTFVAVANHPAHARGRRFALDGTLAGRVIDAASAGATLEVHRADASEGDVALIGEFADGRPVGALLLAVLAAHGTPLGVLAISRPAGEPPFSARDAERLRVVADHAALALWKARLVEEARTANEMKSGFLATVSHELRTPLTALTGYGELVADEILGPLTPAQADVMERMRVVTHQLTGMIEEILTFSALEAGRELVRPVAANVEEVVQAVVAVVEPLAAQKGLAFAAVVPRERPPLVTDPDKLRQILVNLCGNAVKFSERGGVRLVVTVAHGQVAFAVADTGVGIAASDVPRLFRAFAQLDNGLTRRYGGTGLGLYISQRLARLLGGRIEVDSRLGEGSTFTLTLPLGTLALPLSSSL
ncbi:hypothetical protein tb265_23100 [Gemmatimonadetes bacterium T265]|nr:hypothetical protein tb265_23100 [Gemmatimonadetes bacterium T265]